MTARAILGLGLWVGVAAPLTAQAGSDIWLLPVTGSGEMIALGAPLNVTARAGYDNQPSFSADGRFLFYTRIEGGQADIWRWDRETGEAAAVTETDPESEYSAQMMPAADRIAVVRVEADSVQRLWSFDLQGGDPRVLVEALAPVGYYAFAGERWLVAFVLGAPPTLAVVDLSTGAHVTVTDSIGRSIQRIPGGEEVSFPRTGVDGKTELRRISVGDETTTTAVTEALPESQDHAWLPDGSILMGQGSTLFRWSGAGWVALAELPGVTGISRLAVSPDGAWIAVVGDDPPEARP